MSELRLFRINPQQITSQETVKHGIAIHKGRYLGVLEEVVLRPIIDPVYGEPLKYYPDRQLYEIVEADNE